MDAPLPMINARSKMPSLPPHYQAMKAELRRRKDVPPRVIELFDEMEKISPDAPDAEKRARTDAIIAEIVRLMQRRGANEPY